MVFFFSLKNPENNGSLSLSHTHTHTHTRWFLGTFHKRNGFYTVQTVYDIALQQPYT